MIFHILRLLRKPIGAFRHYPLQHSSHHVSGSIFWPVFSNPSGRYGFRRCIPYYQDLKCKAPGIRRSVVETKTADIELDAMLVFWMITVRPRLMILGGRNIYDATFPQASLQGKSHLLSRLPYMLKHTVY